MKKIYLIIAATAILSSVASCNKEELSATDDLIKVDISVSPLESDTKAVKQEWVERDRIHVWLDDTPVDYDGKTTGTDLVLEYRGGEWRVMGSRLRDLTDSKRLKESGGKIRGFYESSDEFSKDSKTWKMNKNWAEFPRKDKDNLIATPVVAYFNDISYTYDSEQRVFATNINDWTFGSDFQLVVTGISLDDEYSLICDDILTMSGIRVVNGGSKRISVHEYKDKTARIAGVSNADGVAFVGKVSNDGKKQRTFTLVKKGDESTRYVFKTSTAVEWNSNNGKRLVANKVSISRFKAAVDLGLTSGTLWADHNVGVGLFGKHYAWGDTTKIKGTYNKESYPYYSVGEGHYTKYRNPGTELEEKDDVARQNWGAAWGTPSRTQWQELFDECDWTWVNETFYTEIGPVGNCGGYRVTSKKNNAASIFLPAAGRQNDEDGGGIRDVNTMGWYWGTRTTNARFSQNNVYADCVRFDSTIHELLDGNNITDAPIYQGCSVRPVVVQ